MVDTETRRVRPVASFGDDTEYLKDIEISMDADSPFGRGPTGTAIREDRLYWCQDFLDDPVTVPWRERAVYAGLAAAAALPLHRKGIVIGAFTLYSGEANAFDEAARDLLVEMATDISFALDNFARESQRKQAEEEIKFKNTILQTQQETSLDAILVVDENGQIISYNQQFIDLWRLSPQLVSARLDAPVLQSVADQVENSEAFVARVQYLNEHRDDKSREEVALKDGRIIDRYSAPSHWSGRQVLRTRLVFSRHHRAQKSRAEIQGSAGVRTRRDGDRQPRRRNGSGQLPGRSSLFGWRREELLGQKIDMLVPERFAQQASGKPGRLFRATACACNGRGLELFGLRKDGSEFPVEIGLSPLETDEGIMVISAIRDITERKQSTQELHESEAPLQRPAGKCGAGFNDVRPRSADHLLQRLSAPPDRLEARGSHREKLVRCFRAT